jgi:hypothetical protein
LTDSRQIGGDDFAACDANTRLSRSSDVFQCLVPLVYVMRDEELVNAIDSSSHLLQNVTSASRVFSQLDGA